VGGEPYDKTKKDWSSKKYSIFSVLDNVRIDQHLIETKNDLLAGLGYVNRTGLEI
jgi:hypothetical protein